MNTDILCICVGLALGLGFSIRHELRRIADALSADAITKAAKR